MPERYIVTTKRLQTLGLKHISDCPDCGFGGLTEGTVKWPSAFRRERDDHTSPFVKGDWKKAVFLRPGVQRTPDNAGAIAKRNVNDFLKHVPCGVLAKGTEFFHVTKNSDWVKKSQVGGSKDFYSFFTLRSKGFASTHSSDFKARIQLRLKEDLHVFFFSAYMLDGWKPFDEQFSGGRTQKQIRKFMPNVGNAVINTIIQSWPEEYRPVAWVGCSECEIVIHNSIVPLMLDTTAIATSEKSFAKGSNDKKIAHISELPASRPNRDMRVGLDGANGPPKWMGPNNYSEAKVKEVESVITKSRQAGWAAAATIFLD